MDPMLRMLQRDERRLMSGTCKITRPPAGSEPLFDPGTGTYTKAPATVVYDGACHVAAMPTDRRVVQANENAVSLRTYEVLLPIAVAALNDDAFEMTTSDDPELVGMGAVVIDVLKGDWETSRRLVVQEEA